MICNFHTCSVCQCEENEIPLPWKQETEYDDVDKKIDETFYKWTDKYNHTSSHWLVESEIDSKEGIFVNLQKNEESYTGYQGQHIWSAIYNENCFSNKFDMLCKEEKMFLKIISGLHSNINVYLSKTYIDLNKNNTFFNTSMLDERLLNHPDRINNLFFLYSILLKAFYKAEYAIKDFNIYTGNEMQDKATNYLLYDIFSQEQVKQYLGIKNEINSFDLFLDFKQQGDLKMRFRNISQIIDCVSCQKCRLHGKLQIFGLSTMFKILSNNNGIHNLKRNELIAFVNLVGKVSKAIRYIVERVDTINAEKAVFISSIESIFLIILISFVLIVDIVLIKLYSSSDFGVELIENKNMYCNNIKNEIPLLINQQKKNN